MTGILNKVVDKSCLTFPYQYTKAEELLASAIKPLHLRKRGPLVQAVQGAVLAVAEGSPSVEQWRVLADAANIAETMLTMGLFDDPDALFTDAVNAVADLGRKHGHGQAMELDAEQQLHLNDFADAYEQMLAQASERSHIQAHRASERRLRELLMNGIGEGDHEFIVN